MSQDDPEIAFERVWIAFRNKESDTSMRGLWQLHVLLLLLLPVALPALVAPSRYIVSRHVTASPITLDVKDTNREAARLLKIARITGAPVVEDGSLCGVLSRNNLLKKVAAIAADVTPEAFEQELIRIQNEEVWTVAGNPVTILPDEPLLHAAHVMSDRKLNRLIVKAQYGSMLGIISSTDVTFALLGCTAAAAADFDVKKYILDVAPAGSDSFDATSGCCVETQVSEFMATKLVTMPPNMCLSDAACLLRAGRVTGAPVVENGELLGVVSRHGLLRALSTSLSGSGEELEQGIQRMKAVEVREVMSTDSITISPGSSLLEAAKVLARERLNRLMVTGEDPETGAPKLRGILSSTDVVFAMLGFDCSLEDADEEEVQSLLENERRRGNLYRKGIY